MTNYWIWSSWIHSKTGIADVIHQICTNKHGWAGHVSWLKDNRWTTCMTEWCPQEHMQPRGHPKLCWWDDLNEATGSNWSHVAKDQLLDRKQRGVPPTGVKQNHDDDSHIHEYFTFGSHSYSLTSRIT